jgi:hypothetical protein
LKCIFAQDLHPGLFANNLLKKVEKPSVVFAIPKNSKNRLHLLFFFTPQAGTRNQG